MHIPPGLLSPYAECDDCDREVKVMETNMTQPSAASEQTSLTDELVTQEVSAIEIYRQAYEVSKMLGDSWYQLAKSGHRA